MDLHYLKLFHVVATNLSFSKTAEQLHISQPAISMQIKKLEDDLGMLLFDRIGRNIYLNGHGKLLYDYTSKIFHLVDEVENKIQQMEDKIWGSLHIGCSNSAVYVVPEIISEYRTLYPLVTINLHVGNTYEINNLMKLNQLDFVIVGGNFMEGQNLKLQKVWEDRLVLIASPMNPLTSTPNFITREQLADQNIITHDYKSKLYDCTESMYKDLELPFQPSMLVGSVETIKYLVEQNHGIAVIPYIAAKKQLRAGTLKEIKLNDKCMPYDYNIAYYKNKESFPPLERLIQVVSNYFTNNTPALM